MFPPNDVFSQPLEDARDLLAYVEQKFGLSPSDLESYAERQAIISAHARQVREPLGTARSEVRSRQMRTSNLNPRMRPCIKEEEHRLLMKVIGRL